MYVIWYDFNTILHIEKSKAEVYRELRLNVMHPELF